MANLDSLGRIAPLYINMRTGQSNDPYRDMDETKKIPPSGFMVLTEIPSELNRVKITGFTEVKQNAHMSAKKFIVDYNRGVIAFHSADVGKSVRMIYSGAGIVALSADRIFTKDDGDKPTEYLSEAIEGYKEVSKNVNKMNEEVDELIQRINTAVVDSEAMLSELQVGLNKSRPQMEELSKLVSEARYNNAKVGEMIEDVKGIEDTLAKTDKIIKTAERALENAKLTQDDMANMQVEILQKVQKAEKQMDDYMKSATEKINKSIADIDSVMESVSVAKDEISKIQSEIEQFKVQSKADIDKMINDGKSQLGLNLAENTKKVDAKIVEYTGVVNESKKLVEDANTKLDGKLVEVDGIVAGVVENNKKELAEMLSVNGGKIDDMIKANDTKIDEMIEAEIARTTELINKTQTEVDAIREDAKEKVAEQIAENTIKLDAVVDKVDNQVTRIENIKYVGEYDKSVAYKSGNIVHYNRDAFIATKDIEKDQPPIINESWSKFASGGIDGEGSVSSVNGIKPNEDGDVSLGDISWSTLTGIPKPLTELEESEDGALTYKGNPIGKQTSVHRDMYIADGEDGKFVLTNPYEKDANATTVYLNGVVQFAGLNYKETDGAIEFVEVPKKDSMVAVVYHELLNTVNVKVDGVKNINGIAPNGEGSIDLSELIRGIVKEELQK